MISGDVFALAWAAGEGFRLGANIAYPADAAFAAALFSVYIVLLAKRKRDIADQRSSGRGFARRAVKCPVPLKNALHYFSPLTDKYCDAVLFGV